MLTCGHASTHQPRRRPRGSARCEGEPATAEPIHRRSGTASTRRRASLGAHRVFSRRYRRPWTRMGRRPGRLGPQPASSRRAPRRLTRMGAVLLDTTVLIDVLRGRRTTIDRLLGLRTGGDTPCTSAVNVEEVVRGLLPREVDAARDLLEGLVVIKLGREEGVQAGDWRRTFARQGRTLSQADCLVAAAAFTTSARLATGNPKDFPMSELSVEHWPVSE